MLSTSLTWWISGHNGKESSESNMHKARSKINKARDGFQKILSAKLMEFEFYPTCDKQSLSSRAGLWKYSPASVEHQED